MRRLNFSSFMLGAMLFLPGVAMASDNLLPFDVTNRLRLEYDDNIRLEPEDEDDSLKIINDLELLKNFNWGNTQVGLRYNLALTFWEDRDEDDTDVHHQFDGSLNHQFNDRVSLSVSDSLRGVELPELVDDGDFGRLRDNNDFLYNSLTGKLTFGLTEYNDLGLSARLTTVSFDEDQAAAAGDYDKTVFGIDLGHLLTEFTRLALQLRLSETDYDNDGLDSEGFQIGGELSHQAAEALHLTLRAGYSERDFDNTERGSTDTPYGQVDVTYNVDPATTLNAGVRHSFSESAVNAFANQERTSLDLGLRKRFGAATTWGVTLAYILSAYDNGERDPDADIGGADGDEEFMRFSTKLSYQFHPTNWVDLSYQYNDLSSDLSASRDYTRNRFSISWRTKL